MKIDLTTEEGKKVQAAIEEFKVSASLPRFALNEYVGKWQYFVQTVQRGYELSIYDYTNDLTVRDILQRFLDALPQEIKKKVAAAIEPIDHQFLLATEESEAVLASAKEDGALPWWWHRVPKNLHGELKEDIESLG